MQHTTCTFCGEATDNVLEVYRGASVAERQVFCGPCIETGAEAISFQRDRELSNRVVLQSLHRLVHLLLRELREVRQEQAILRRELKSEPPAR